MPSVAAEPRSVLSNSTNSSSDGPRKSHDKTISGVFAYTNGTDVDTGLSDHRLDQIRNHRNGSHSSLTNGIPNGSLASRERTSSKAASTHSIASAKNVDTPGRNIGSSDGLTKLSNVENASEEEVVRRNGEGQPLKINVQAAQEEGRNHNYMFSASTMPDSGFTDGQMTSSPQKHDPHHMFSASTVPDSAWGDGHLSASSPNKHLQPLARFSSPPNLSPVDRARPSADMPRLTQRHTLGVPKPAATAVRSSRDFSFAGGPSEEALTTGRFSPTRDSHDASGLRLRRASLGLVRRATRSVQSDAHLDEVLPDEDAARWTEVIKQKRASRRKRREEEDDDRVIVGKKVDEGHVNWVIAYNMLTGIRFTVSRTNAKMDRDLTEADFDAKHKFSFDVTGNELTPSAKYDFKFKDYAPWVFRHLRANFGCDPADYLMSLTSKYILSELGSPGKSGSFFYFSRDYKYIIKTIHHAEHKLMRKILREYYQHVTKNPNTLVSQIYGLHRVKIPYGRKIHFMVMNNLFPPHRDIHQTFDLKGSTIGRDFREEELSANPRATLKDLNWLRRDYHLQFDPDIKQKFLEQLQQDVSMFQKMHIMDYSLLIGIHDLARGNEENVRGTTLQVFQPGGNRDGGETETSMLTRTPSRLESAKKARALRNTLKRERPVPMGLVRSQMPSEMPGDERHDRLFYKDDGGIRATHEDGTPGELIYYLGIIDCLTHYGIIKRLEHFWKGLHDNRTQISPIPPQGYGDRFINFVSGITMTKEESERRQTNESSRTDTMASVIRSRQDSKPQSAPLGVNMDGAADIRDTFLGVNHVDDPAGSPAAVERTMEKAQKATDKQTGSEGRRRSEEEKPSRTLQTTEEQRGNALLPVVTEGKEDADSEGGSRGASTTRELEDFDEKVLPPPAHDLSRGRSSEGIRIVSASTKAERDSDEHARQEMTQIQGEFNTDEGCFRSKVQDQVDRSPPAAHGPLGEEEEDDDYHVVDEKERPVEEPVKRRSKPPRINSDLIPRMSPLDAGGGVDWLKG